MSSRNASTCGALLCAAALVSTTPAWADNPECATISGGAPIIYGAGGSAQAPLVGKAAVVLQGATNPVFVVYKDDTGACTGINALTGLGPTTITGNAKYWDTATGSQLTCTLPVVGGATVQFASMGNGPLLCPLVTDISYVDGILDVTGPISTVNVLVPNASTQQAISAEAFYLIYGLGPAANIAPWNNPDTSYYIHRNQDSYVQLYLATASGLPVTKFFGVDAGSNTNSIALLNGLGVPEQGISFASGEVADANRATVRTLAWQHTGQNAAWWPDSSASSFDKINVRNGLYFLWGPGHFYAPEGAPGEFADPNVGAFLEYLSGASQPAGTSKTITDVAIANKNVPQCAMKVKRDGDLTPIYAWNPPEPCGCYFEFKATGASTCQACDDTNRCSGSNVCRFGFCEEY
jgi:hypothetical protein